MADYYSDGDGPATDQATNHQPTPPGPEKESPGEGKTALLNSEICPGMKPGDEIVLRISAVHDGEYEVEYSPEPESEREESQQSESPDMAGPAPSPSEAMGSGMYE